MKFNYFRKMLLMAAAALILGIRAVHGCTGFAVYAGADRIFYGMNFDYSDTDLIFSITGGGNPAVFEMGFNSGGGWSYTTGMNDLGFFCSDQEQYPLVHADRGKGPNELYVWDLHRHALSKFSRVGQIPEYLSDKRLVHPQTWASCHVLAADESGQACIVEVGDADDVVIPMDKRYMVMTNFRNADFPGVPVDRVTGAGADRYKTACRYIEGRFDEFDFDDGIELLGLTAQGSTQCSMLFLPLKKEVYVMLKRNFDQIWRLSIPGGFIETYQGFGGHARMPLGSSSIRASELQSAASRTGGAGGGTSLRQNHPNPFVRRTTIEHTLGAPCEVRLTVADLHGRKLETLAEGSQTAGAHRAEWDATGFAGGIYFYRLEAGGRTETRKMILLK
jgi:hypothetical protein